MRGENPFAISYLNWSVSDSLSVRADEFASKFNNIFFRFYCRLKNYWKPTHLLELLRLGGTVKERQLNDVADSGRTKK